MVHRVFIGTDPRQFVTYTVAQHSIVRRSSSPVAVTPLIKEQLPIEREGATPFSYTRYLVPWLCGYQGWAVFLDADFIALSDIDELFAQADEQYAMMVCREKPRFEWSAVMLLNCARLTMLTPEFVDSQEDISRLQWLDDAAIGSLDGDWGCLVGYEEPNPDAKMVHYTQGAPVFPEIGDCEFSWQWHSEHASANSFQSWKSIMGPTVHAANSESNERVPKLTLRDETHREVSRTEPSQDFRERFGELQRLSNGDSEGYEYAHPQSRQSQLLAYPRELRQVLSEYQATSLLDFGLGKGCLYQSMRVVDRTVPIWAKLKAAWELDELSFYDPTYTPLSVKPRSQSDVVLVHGVLERWPEEDLAWLLDEIFELSSEHVFLSIAGWCEAGQLPSGLSLQPVERPIHWWVEKLEEASKKSSRSFTLLYEHERGGEPSKVRFDPHAIAA